MNAFNRGDYTYTTDAGTVSVHVPADIEASDIASAVAKLAASKDGATEPKAA